MENLMKYFLLLTLLANTQLLMGQTLTDAERVRVTSIAEQYAASFLDSWSCPIARGATTISSKETLGDNLIYSGKVGYRSGNCGAVNANLRVEFRQESGSIYLIRVCIQMPYCIFGNVIRYDNECRDYYQRFDSWLESSPVKKTIAVTPSDVDSNIPNGGTQKGSAYALVIGNEDYSSFQTGLNSEVNVDYAENDARTFAQYCIKTLGVPERQVKTLVNATAAQMRQGLAWLSELAAIENGNAELIFYYSGHGLPHEETHDPYLIPVDVSSGQLGMAIPLAEVYKQLNQSPTKRCLVFLDACFSGGARNKPLASVKGVKVVPRASRTEGRMVVLASSSNDESSGVFQEKQHGYFTYFLLKKLQETRAHCTLEELFEYVGRNVLKESTLSGKKQTPTVIIGNAVMDEWKTWRFAE